MQVHENPVLAAISQAAQEIAAERQRLNNTYDALVRSVMAYDPTVTLDEKGNIASASEYKAVVEAGSKTPGQPRERITTTLPPLPSRAKHDVEEEAVRQRRQRAEEFAAGVRDQLMREEAEASTRLDRGETQAVNPAAVGFDTEVVARVRRLTGNRLGSEQNAGKWYSAKQVTSMLKEPYNLVAFVLNDLVVDKVLERRAEAKASEGVQYRFPTPSPKPSAKPASSVRKPASAPSATTTESSSSGATSAARKQASSAPASADRGLARSPKPRSEMKAGQRAAEEKLDQLVAWLADYTERPIIAGNIAEDAPFGWPQSWYTNALRTLEERKIVKQEGTAFSRTVLRARKAATGRRAGQGRSSNAYWLNELESTTPPPTPPASPQTGSDNHETSAMRQVRDWFVKQKVGNVFSPGKIAEVTELDRELVLSILLQYVERGSLENESPSPDMPLFSYIKPKSPGKAAQHDAKRGGSAPSQTSSGPVAGTGRGDRAANAEVQAILDSVVRAGGTVEKTGKHWAVYIGGKRDIIAGTPNASGLVKDRAKVRKMIAEAMVKV